MAKRTRTRFVTRAEMKVERYPWGPHDWLARPDVVDAEQLLAVRIHMPRGEGTPFHRHPEMEELVYILHGRAEQWVGEEVRELGPGDVAHIPKDTVHATFNAGRGVLRLLSVLGPARPIGTVMVDVGHEEPWASIRSLGRATVAKKRTALKRAKARSGRAPIDAKKSAAKQVTSKTRGGKTRKPSSKR